MRESCTCGLTARLDHPSVDIKMLTTSEVERTLRVNACEKEKETVAWVESFSPGSVFWDVGANVGPYSLLAAALSHDVHAFEPALPNVARLAENAALNQLSLHSYPIALGASDGVTGLNQTSLEPGATHGKRYEANPFPVLTLTARHLVCHMKVPAPDHVKIDVDGAEVEVLRGFGLDLVHRPKSWLIEADHDTTKAVHETMQRWGYSFVESFPRSEPGCHNLIYEDA